MNSTYSDSGAYKCVVVKNKQENLTVSHQLLIYGELTCVYTEHIVLHTLSSILVQEYAVMYTTVTNNSVVLVLAQDWGRNAFEVIQTKSHGGGPYDHRVWVVCVCAFVCVWLQFVISISMCTKTLPSCTLLGSCINIQVPFPLFCTHFKHNSVYVYAIQKCKKQYVLERALMWRVAYIQMGGICMCVCVYKFV